VRAINKPGKFRKYLEILRIHRMLKKLFIYCAGGFGREVFDVALRVNEASSRWEEIAFIDDGHLGDEFYGARLFMLDKVIERFDLSSFEVVIASGEPAVRKLIYNKLKSCHVSLTTLIDPSATISKTAKIGEGVIVTAYCSVASLAVVGNNVAVNVQSIIGHDVKVGEHCVISSLVNLGGACPVGESSYIGMGTQIKQGVVIGRDVIVGMGSVVHHDMPDNVIALGNPARPLRENTDKKVFKRSSV
jgi:sugar O-acyltransferase (sialic acid O-acetyltransferase NeuD family)